MCVINKYNFILCCLKVKTFFHAINYKKITTTTLHVLLFAVVFISSWATPQEEAYANEIWECNDASERAYFYKLDWEFTDNFFTISQYVATSTSTVNLNETTISLSGLTVGSTSITGVKGINGLAMSPDGRMYVTITSSANGTDLFQINNNGSLTHKKNMGSYGTIGQLDFYQLPGGGGHYGFSAGEYVSKDGIDRIYFSQGAFDTDSDGNGTDIARPNSNMIYNVTNGTTTTFPDPGFVSPINAADYAYVGDWDGFELVTYDAINNKIHRFDIDNPSNSSSIDPQTSAFSGASTILSTFSYKTPQGEIRFIADDTNGMRFEIVRNGTNNYSVTQKGSSFLTNNSDGASCGPNAFDPFSPTFKATLTACSNGFATPQLLITNNKSSTQYFDVDVSIDGGSFTNLVDGQSVTPGANTTISANQEYDGRTIQFRMRYNSSNPSSGTYYNVGSQLTVSGCGNYTLATGSVATANGTCISDGTSKPTITLTATGNTTVFFDVEYKVGNSAWQALKDGEQVAVGSPETYEITSAVAHNSVVTFRYIVEASNPSGTNWTESSSVTVNCPVYSMTASLDSPSCANTAFYKNYTMTVQNTGNQAHYVHIKGNINENGESGTESFIEYNRYISANSSYTFSFQMWHGVTPQIRWIHSTNSNTYQIFANGVNGSLTSNSSYGSNLKSGDSFLTLTDSEVDCFHVGSGGYSDNSNSNYVYTTKTISQVCDAQGSATARFTIKQRDAANDSYNGFIDVDYSTNGSTWSTLADGAAFNDGVTLTYDSPSSLSSGSTAYFRFRIDETDPDSTAAWGIYTQAINCQADFSVSQSVSSCSASGQTTTLTITNNESQTIYFRAVPSKVGASNSETSSTNYEDDDIQLFSIAANTTYSHTTTKTYTYGVSSYMYWKVQGSFTQSPDWTNTTLHNFNYTSEVQTNCNPSTTGVYAMSSCSDTGKTSTLTIQNNESVTIYVRIQPSETQNTSTSYTSATIFDNAPTPIVYAIPANTTYTYDANSRPGFQATYQGIVSQYSYAHWRYQVSYVESVTWTSTAFPYNYVSQAASSSYVTAGSYQIDCRYGEVIPTQSTFYQYQFPDNTKANACINNEIWVTNEFYTTNYGNQDYNKMWWIFEYSVDDGSNWSTADIFYRRHYTNNNLSTSSQTGVPSSQPTSSGWLGTTTTGTYIELPNSNLDFFTIGTRVADGSVVLLRYKKAFTQSALSSAAYIELGSQNKSTTDRTAECDVDLTDFIDGYTGPGSGYTSVQVSGTEVSNLLWQGTCQNNFNTGYADTAFLIKTDSGSATFFMKLEKKVDGASSWTTVYSNFTLNANSPLQETVQLNHGQTIQYKLQISPDTGDFSNATAYTTPVLTVNCPSTGAQLVFALGDCVSGGNKPVVTITNTGYLTAHYDVDYSVDQGNTWLDAFGTDVYKTVLPDETTTFTFTPTMTQGQTVALKYRHAPTAPVTSGTFTTVNNTILVDCDVNSTIGDVLQVYTDATCYGGNQRFKVKIDNDETTSIQLQYRASEDGGSSWPHTGSVTVNASTDDYVTIPIDFQHGDSVTFEFRTELTATSAYSAYTSKGPYTVSCNLDDYFTLSTSYDGCASLGPDLLKLKAQKTQSTGNSYNYLHFDIEISHDGTTWNPFGPWIFHGYGNTEQWTTGSVYFSQTYYNSAYPSHSGYINVGTYGQSDGNWSAYHFVDSSHAYKIRYRYYNSSSTTHDHAALMNLSWTTMDVAANLGCESNDIEPVTLVSTQQQCQENRGKVQFTFTDTTVSHTDPYEQATLIYRYSTNGGTTYSNHTKVNLNNSTTFELPTSATLPNTTVITVQWGYIRDFSKINTYFDHIGSTNKNGLHTRMPTSTQSYNDGTLSTNFSTIVYENTTNISVDCDPDSTYSQTVTECVCSDSGANSTLTITNNENYTTYYKVMYSLDGGLTWQYSNPNIESAYDISVAAGASDSSQTVFVPDGQTIQWRIKDTTNGGDFVGQDWEAVDASETVDCGCSGGVVDLTLGSCGNGSTTPTVTLDVNSTDTTYFKIEYKRSTDSDWVVFKSQETVTGGNDAQLQLDVTVPHSATIQVRYRISKSTSTLDTAELKYSDTLTVDCPFNTVSFTPNTPVCTTNNVQQPNMTVVNTTSSTSAAYVNVQYKIINTTTSEDLAAGNWANTTLMGDLLPANGAAYVTGDTINVSEGQKIIWRYEWSYTSTFSGSWTYDQTASFVNCVKDFTVTQTLGTCNAGVKASTVRLTNNETFSTLYFKVERSFDNVNFTVVQGNVEVAPTGFQEVSVDVQHSQRIYWRVTATNISNNYTAAYATVASIVQSDLVDCPVVAGTAETSLGNCVSGAQVSTFSFTNPVSSNANAWFHIQYTLDGGSNWTTIVEEVQPGNTEQKTISVPSGQTIRWKYYPHTQVATPSGVTYIELQESPVSDCTFDTIETVAIGECDTNGEALSSYVIQNNTGTNLYYKIQYKIQGESVYTTVDDDFLLNANTTSTAFTKSVPSGKYIEWRYSVSNDLNLIAVATPELPVQSATVNCSIIDPGFEIAQGSCRDGSKDAYFYAKNGAAATSDVYFQVEVSVNGEAYTSAGTIIVGPNSQATIEKTNLSNGNTIKWRYKTSKDNVTYSTDYSESSTMTITCLSGDDVAITIPTTCNSNGTKTATVTTVNNSSSDKFYLIEYSLEQSPSNWVSLTNNFGLVASNTNTQTKYLSEGEYFTVRYKISNTNTTSAFAGIDYIVSETKGPVNCSGDIEWRVALDACQNGKRDSVFYYLNKPSTGAPVYFLVEYSIDGGAWTNPKAGQTANYYTALHTNSAEQSISVEVGSGSTIQWRFKDSLSTDAFSNKSFTSGTPNGPLSVLCDGSISHAVTIGSCVERKASSTLTLTNDGFVDVYADVWVSYDGGTNWNNHATSQKVINTSPKVFTQNNIANGSVVKWKYKYASTSDGISSASEILTDDKPAIDCDSLVTTQITYSHAFSSCVEGQRVGTFTINNPSSTNNIIYVEVQYRTKSSQSNNIWTSYNTLSVESIAAGSSKTFNSPSLPSGGYVDWRFRASLGSNDFAGDWTNDTHPGYQGQCFQSSTAVHTLDSCVDGEQYSKLTITNTGSVTQYYKVQIQINNGNWDTKFPSQPIDGDSAFEFRWPIQQGETIRWQYVASTDTDFSDDSFVPSLAKTNQCTPVFSLQTQTVCADASTLNSNQVKNTKVTLTLNNTSLVDGSVTVQYRYLQTDSWKTLTTTAISAGNSKNVEYTLVDPYVEFQYAPFGTTNWNNSGMVYKVTNCETVGNPLTAQNTFICSEDQPFAQVKITNPTTTNQTVTYSYSFDGTSWVNEKNVVIQANSTHLSDLISVTKGTQIRWRYKPTNLTDNDYKTLTSTAPINCSDPVNQQIVHTLGVCDNNKALSTFKLTNLSSSQKSYLLEYKIDNGAFARYETLIISANNNTSRTLQISEGQNIQWRIIDATSDASTIAVDGNWTSSSVLTLSCTTTTTTTLPDNMYIFEPLISTSRVCNDDTGGALFGITVDNSRSNVDASVVQRVLVDKFIVFEKQETIPAGQLIQFSSFDISEDKFFTVEFEVTNVMNSKTQEMVKNKTSNCLEDGLAPTDDQNPLPGIDYENLMDGTGDDYEMEDNGTDIFFLPGDDFVEWLYDEDATSIIQDPICPGDPSCDYYFGPTGSNVGRIILILGSLLMVAGGFILRRGYRF